MHPIRKYQLVFGTVWGVAAFLLGLAATYYAVGTELLSEIERWQTAAWMFLSANGIGVEAKQLGGGLLATHRVNLLSEYPEFRYLRAMPFGLSVIAGMLVSDSIGYSHRPRHIFENCLAMVPGYVFAGIVLLYLSDAQPSFEAIVLILLVLGAAIFIGGTILSRIGGSLAFIGIVSIWGVLGVGLLALGGGVIIVHTLAPLVLYPTVGALISAVLLIVARRVNI